MLPVYISRWREATLASLQFFFKRHFALILSLVLRIKALNLQKKDPPPQPRHKHISIRFADLFLGSLLIFFLLPARAKGFELPDDLLVGGYLKNETAFRFQDPATFTKIRNTLFLESTYKFNQRSQFFVSGWAWYDAAYLYSSYDTINPPNDPNLPLPFVSRRQEEDYRDYADLLEVYVDYYATHFDLRIGKQIVVWEKLLGFRIVDEINPLDFREFVLPDLIDFRIPLWTLKLDYYFKPYTLEFLWIPIFEPHKPAPPGSEWELFQRLPEQEEPAATFENSEVGARLLRTIQGIDLAFSYLYLWDPFPTPFREYTGFRFINPPDKCIPTSLDIDQTITDPDCGPIFHPEFNRIHIFGVSAGFNLGTYILTGELSYIEGKYFGSRLADRDGDSLLDFNGALKRDHIRWGLGIDSRLWNIDYSLAISQWILFGYDQILFQDQYDTFISFFGQKALENTKITTQIFILYLINNAEVLVKPKLSYPLTERMLLALGADLFFGNRENFLPDLAAPASDRTFKFISTFEQHNRIFWELKYSF